MVRNKTFCVVAALLVIAASPVTAQTASEPTSSIRASAATYVLSDEENYVQPTVTADRGALHLETRYNYEDRESMSAFVGWNFAFGDKVTVELTPMLGGAFGSTDGFIPALKADFTWRLLEAYAEGEYVIDAHDSGSSFLYNWSELSVWATEWLRAGAMAQRTRVFRTPREIQRGVLVGVTRSRLEGSLPVQSRLRRSIHRRRHWPEVVILPTRRDLTGPGVQRGTAGHSGPAA